MDRCALFVDAGYLLADGSMAVHGTRHREAVSWDFGGLLQLLGNLARERTGMPLLRCYWYEATVEGRRAPEHEALADLPGLKLRLGRVRPGRSEGVDTEIHRDLMTLARNGAIADAVLVSGDEDLSQVISDAQDLGVRVTVVHVSVDGNWTISRMLRQECDDLIEIGSGHLRPYITLLAGVDKSSTTLSNGHGSSSFGSFGSSSGSGSYASPSSGSGSYASSSGSSGYGSSSGPGGYGSSSGSSGYGSSSGSSGYASSGSSGYGSGSSIAPLPSTSPYSSPPPSSPINDRYPTPQLSAPKSSSSSSSSPSSSSSSSSGISQHPLVSGALSAPPPKPSTPPPPPSQAPSIPSPAPAPPQPQSYLGQSSGSSYSQSSLSPSQRGGSTGGGSGGLPPSGPYTGPQQMTPAPVQQSAPTLSDAVKAAHQEGQDFGESVARDAPALWLEAVLARKPRMPSDLEARLLQGSSLPIDFLLHDEVRHALRRGFWDALERSRR